MAMSARSIILALAMLACGSPVDPSSDAGARADGGGSMDAARAQCSTNDECDDELYCNGAERCDPSASTADGRGCVSGAAPCAAQEICDEASAACSDCALNADADGDGQDAVACGGDDCADDDADRFAGNAEVCDASHDEDCNVETYGARDLDGDGHDAAACCNVFAEATRCGDDCDDGNPDAHPGVPEVCNGIDDNCNGMIDEGLLVPMYPDADGDMFGDRAAAAMMRCPGTAGYSDVATDCDDADVSIYPGATEACDTVDDDCDGVIDEDAGTTYYRDLDHDGFGVTSMTVQACALPPGYAVDPGDCNDMSAAARPFGTETCDGVDNDCNGMVDEVLGSECTVGTGACQRTGLRRCDGTCSATPGAPGTYATAPALNGSWDHDCDGVIEPEWPDDPVRATRTQSAFCSMYTYETCPSGSTTRGWTHPETTAAPHCGATHYYMEDRISGARVRPCYPNGGICDAYNAGSSLQRMEVMRCR